MVTRCLFFLVAVLFPAYQSIASTSCESPATASVGENITSPGDAYTWYQFTMSQEGKLLISSEVGINVQVTRGNCGNLWHVGDGNGNLGISSIAAGEEVFITWSTEAIVEDFNWNISIENVVEGNHCTVATPATEGTQSVPATNNQYHWFSFQMPEEGKLILESQGEYFVEVVSNSCDNYSIIAGGQQKLTVTSLSQGDEVFFRWYTQSSGGNFDFTLTVEEIFPGERCDLAVPVEAGAIDVPATNAQYFWNSFTMPQDGKLVVQPPSGIGFVAYKNGCDNLNGLGSSSEEYGISGLKMGDELLIQWYTENGGGYEAGLSVVESVQGEACDWPVIAAVGSNLIPQTNSGFFWYTYTMPQAGKLIITTESTDDVRLLDSNCENQAELASGYGAVSLSSLAEGEEVFIKWHTQYSGGNLSWNLAVEGFGPGDVCESAIEAVLGENVTSNVTSQDVWYSFLMPEDGKVLFSADVYNHFYIYRGTCGDLAYLDQGQYNGGASDLIEGDQLYIHWKSVPSGSAFTLSVEPIEPGEICSNPALAEVGTNSLPSTVVQYYWYSYVMPSSGKLVVEASIPARFSIYSASCENPAYLGGGSGVGSATDLVAGDEVLISWYSQAQGGGFDWTLAVEELTAGDNCALAIEPLIGQNEIPETTSSHYWYKFQMPVDKKATITTIGNNSIEVFTGNCESLVYYGVYYGTYSLTGINPGTFVYLKLNTSSEGELGGFSWSFVFEDFSAGDICSTATEVSTGENYISSLSTDFSWYHFTMPSEGKLAINSELPANLYIYSGSCDNLVYQASQYSAVTTGQIAQGEEIFIQWYKPSYNGHLSWSIAIESTETGDTCEMPAQAVVGTNVIPAMNSQYLWYTFTMPEAGILFIDSETQNIVNVLTPECSATNFLGGGYGAVGVSGLQAGDMVLIKWYTYSSGNGFSWNLSIEQPTAGEECAQAIPAVEGANDVPLVHSSHYWYTFTMPVSGKLKITSAVNVNVLVKKGNCETTGAIQTGNGVEVPSLFQGDQLLIKIATNANSNLGGFTWNLSIEDYAPGDLCTLPYAASEGTNTLPATDLPSYWYSFVMPQNGKILIGSDYTQGIAVYSNTCEHLLAKGWGQGMVASENLTAGEQIFISWFIGYDHSALDWSLSVLSTAQGENCELAVAAQSGENSLPSVLAPYYWYSYTMPSDGMLHIDSEQTVQVEALSANCESPAGISSGRGSLGLADIEAGEEIYLRWNTQGIENGFDWQISVEPFSAGDKCDIAIEAAEGTNDIASSVDQWTWYSFTMPREGTLNLTNDAMATVGVYSGSCTGLSYHIIGSSPVAVSGIPAGEQVFIKWQGQFNQGSSWSMTIEDYNEGQSCDLPMAASEGSHTQEVGNSQYLWYSFTMPREGKLRLSSEQDYRSFEVYTQACDNLLYKLGGQGSGEITSIPEGEDILIRWAINGFTNELQWELEVLDLVEGDNCELAIAATEGVNYIPETSSHYVWYSFEMPTEGKLVIASESNDKVSVFYNSCEFLFQVSQNYGSVSIGDTYVGKQFFIRWETKASGGDFNWTLNIEDFQEGESCLQAKTAFEGENHVPPTTIDNYWYSFAMPRTGKINIVSDYNVEVYSGACDFPQYVTNGSGNVSATNFVEGEKVLLKWNTAYNGGNFNFEISVSDLEVGNSCNMAIEANEGTNQLQASASYHWYQFTMPWEGKLSIQTDAYSSVEVFSNLCSNLTSLQQGFQQLSLASLDAGTEILIRWETSNTPEFSWQLSIEDLTEGDRCTVSKSAVEGINSVPLEASNAYWFTFTMPIEGKLVIKSENNNPVLLYRGCEEGGYFANGRKLLSLVDLAAGETINLKWELWDESAFEWQLDVVEFEEGDKCETAAIALEGENMLPEADASYYWYRFTMPSEKRLRLTSESTAYVEVYSHECQSMVFRGSMSGGEGSFGTIAANEEVFIKWWSGGTSFSWNLLLEEPAAGDACESAIVAGLGVNTVPASDNAFTWFKYTMPQTGKLQYSSTSNDYLNFYSGACGAFVLEGFGSRYADITSLQEGDEVLIRIESWQSGGGYDFTLELLDLQPGDNCTMPLEAVVGNNVIAPTESNKVWAHFTMPQAGRLGISSPNSALNLYKGGCGYQDMLFGNYKELELTSLQQGDDFYLEFITATTNGDFSYSISVEPEMPGDACDQPLIAVSGPNLSTQQIQWFEYTVPAEGYVTVSSKNSGNTFSRLKLYAECESSPVVEAESFYGAFAKLENLVKGQKILIHWDDFNGTKGYKWYLNFTSTVIKQNQAITFSELAGLTYGETLPVSATASSGFPVTIEVVSGEATIENGTVKPTGIGEVVLRATQAGDLYYINPAEPITRSLTVLPAEISVTADNLSIVYGEAIPTLTMTLSGLVNDETQAVIKTSPIAQIAEAVPLSAGTYDIVPSGGSADNYTFKYVKGKLTVYKAPQTITFGELADASLSVGGRQLQASSSSNLAVSFAAEGPATIAGDQLTFTGLGLVTVTASQTGDNNYNAAEPVVRSFNVVAAAQYSVSGTVSGSSGEVLEGTVTATLSGGAVSGTAELENGAFTVSGLADGVYYLRYIPAGASTQTHRSTYYAGAALASEGTILEVSGADVSGVTWTAIAKVQAPVDEGSGTISGKVVAGGNGRGVRVILGRSMETGAPLEGITVYLLKAADNSIVREALTDAQGSFTMTGLPGGSYKFHVDVPGIEMDAGTSAIELDEDVPLIITAMVSDEGIVADVSVIKGIVYTKLAITFYPNPVIDLLTIKIDGEISGFRVRLVNMLGQEQYSTAVTGSSYSVEMTYLPAGVYFCTIFSTEGYVLRQMKLKKE